MPVIALCIEYDGSFFQGFQRQTNGLSVQQALEDAFLVAYKESIRIAAAGRTDTGVHARGMIVSFRTEKTITDYHRMISALNALTGEGVSVLNAMQMPDTFHARFSCTEREYEYLLVYSKYKRPIWEGRAYWTHDVLDLQKIRSQLEDIRGRHDFKSFAKSVSVQDKSTERMITNIEIVPSQEFSGLYCFKIRGTGFLHNMIRIMVGTILGISTGKIKSSLAEILVAEDRKLAGITLPPYGLYFKRAYYEKYPEINKLY